MKSDMNVIRIRATQVCTCHVCIISNNNMADARYGEVVTTLALLRNPVIIVTTITGVLRISAVCSSEISKVSYQTKGCYNPEGYSLQNVDEIL
jgi:hypothetical protein